MAVACMGTLIGLFTVEAFLLTQNLFRQLKAGFRRWQSLSGNTDVANISSEEFSSLADFTCGLELADIQKLDETTFK